MEADGRMAVLPKKEQILLRKELSKLQTNLNGIRNMKRTPERRVRHRHEPRGHRYP